MNLLIGLIPAVLWGTLPMVLRRFVKGGSWMQMLGAVVGTAAIALVIQIVLHPLSAEGIDFWLCFFAGVGWTIGASGQFLCFELLGVATTMPVSAGMQIVANGLLGWLALHEWKSGLQVAEGLGACALVVLGIFLCADRAKEKESAAQKRKGMVILTATTIGFCMNTLLPKLAVSTAPISQFEPEALGEFLSGIFSACIIGKMRWSKETKKNLPSASLVGTLYGASSLAMLASIQRNGMVRGFMLGQLNLVISTLGGIFLLHEKRSISLAQTYAGLACILCGCLLIQIV